ncbi:FERM and PDZ domain-containing protein 2 [Manis javanica]|nr:FERM and PDZ domain-containing protein 2 [Manis javanica]
MGDLAPLGFQPRHRELKPLAHSVNRLLQSVRTAGRGAQLHRRCCHELRTPVAAIRVHAEALNNLPLPAGLADRLGARLDALVGCSARASRLVDQMLALMRADAGPPAPGMQSLEIDRLLQQRLGCLAGLARERGVELDLDAEGPLPLWGERQAMESRSTTWWTTPSSGGGSGLGLAIVAAVVRQHGEHRLR